MTFLFRSRLPVLLAALAVLPAGAFAAASPPAAERPAARVQRAGDKLAYQANMPAVHPNLARGLDIGNRFDTDGFTAINLFNGNLMAALNVGPVYPVDSRLSYGLALHYNSHIWDFQPLSSEGHPSVFANAGLGFDLSLGRLLAPGSTDNPTTQWLYVAPDGSPHLFYSDLHHDMLDPSDPSDAVQYTRDNTYLRLKIVTSSLVRVESPDGTWKEFAAAGGAWRLSRIASPSGLGVDVTYAVDGLSWTLTDSHGRTQTVYLMVDPLNAARKLVDRVEVAAFGGVHATWDLAYGTLVAPHDCTDSRGGAESLTVLTSLTDPVGQTQTFAYESSGCAGGGRLKRMKLASGGYLEWTYATWTFPKFDCATKTPSFYKSVSAVASRKKVLPDNTVIGTWTYGVATDASPTVTCGFDGRRTIVTAPSGDKTVYHFGFGMMDGTAGGPQSYGLPVAPATYYPPVGDLNLAQQIYDCSAASESCVLVRNIWEHWTFDTACATSAGVCFDTNRRLTHQRTVYLDDPTGTAEERYTDVSYMIYDGVGNFRRTTRTSNFGHGDYLQTIRQTNPELDQYPHDGLVAPTYVPPILPDPWVLFDYSFAQRTDETGASVRSDACFAADGSLLRTRNRVASASRSSHDVVSQNVWLAGEVSESSLYGGDLQTLGTGSDLCALTLPAPAATLRYLHSNGSLARQTDVDASGTAVPFHRLDRDIDANTGLTSVDRDLSGIATTYLYDLVGRRTWEKRAQGSWSQTVYDLPTGASAWNSGPKATTYDRPNGGGTALRSSVLLNDVFGQRTGDWTSQPGGSYTGKRWQYDAQGFVTAESNAYLPGGSAPIAWNNRLDLDPFGRPRTVRPAEGTVHDEVFVYRGERVVQRTYQAGKAYTGATHTCYEDDVVETIERDGQGRDAVRTTSQPLPLQGRVDEVQIAYDVHGQRKLETVRHTVGTTTRESETESARDGRGFLLSTILREDGHTASTTTFEDFDARGLDGTETSVGDLHPSPGASTLRTYDAAGRLVAVADAATPSKLWKEWSYGTSNSGADKRLGKLTQAVRHNYFESTHHTVTESYVYAATDGRVSEKTVALVAVSSPSVDLRMEKTYRMTASFDALGAPASIGFPICLVCTPGEPTASFVLNPTYSQGWLTALAGTRGATAESWLSGVTWSLSGKPNVVTHANNIQDVFDADPFNLPRSSEVRVRTTAGVVRYDSGPIVFDGAGDRCGVGTQSSVEPPYAGPSAPPAPTGACSMPYVIDPFGQWSGEIADPACLGSALPSLKLFDAADRIVALLNRQALHEVTTGGVSHWLPDPAHFVRTWRLFGLDGKLLSEVEDQSNLAWKGRTDFVNALGRLQGKALQTSAAPGVVQQVHKHPMGVRNTGFNGNPLANEL